MRRFASLAALAGVLAVAAPAHAQNDCNIICSPVFVMQHGVIFTDFIDAPSGVESNTEFLVRFTTAFGTQFDPLFFAFLIQWTAFNNLDSPLSGKNNAPVLVYGPGFHTLGGSGAFIDLGSAADYFALDLLPLLVYGGRGPGDDTDSPYTHKLVLEADAFINIGKVIDPNNNAPYLNAINIYGILDYITDGLGTFAGDLDPEPSRWVLLLGLTMPLAPIPGG